MSQPGDVRMSKYFVFVSSVNYAGLNFRPILKLRNITQIIDLLIKNFAIVIFIGNVMEDLQLGLCSQATMYGHV